jgi:hypothetical protein
MARIATFLLEKVLPASSRAGRRPIFLSMRILVDLGQGQGKPTAVHDGPVHDLLSQYGDGAQQRGCGLALVS